MIAPAHAPHTSRLRWAAALAALLCIGAVLFFVLGRPGPTDQEQIFGILDQIREGVAHQNVGECFAAVSSDFQVASLNRQQARLETAQLFHQHASTSLVLRSPNLNIQGDRATLALDTELDGSPMNGGASTMLYHGIVQLELAREPTRKWLFFPSHAWKITKAQAPNAESIIGL